MTSLGSFNLRVLIPANLPPTEEGSCGEPMSTNSTMTDLRLTGSPENGDLENIDSNNNNLNSSLQVPQPLYTNQRHLNSNGLTDLSNIQIGGVHHALRLGFLSTLGPGIPVTPTESVFGDTMPGFYQNQGGVFGYSPEEERKLVRKIDWRLVPILSVLYGLSSLNRLNLTNARVFALENSLQVTHEQFSLAVASFFVGYGLAEIPTILGLLKFTPRVWVPFTMVIWGFVSFSMAWIKSLEALLAMRFFLGIFEAGLVPAVLLYVSMFYKRSEQSLRMAFLFTFSSLSAAFGALISGAIGKLHGTQSLHGWQWVFILESIPTIVVAILSWFLLAPNPESASWLNQRETSIAVYRIRNDTKIKVTRQISKHHILAALTDPKVYILMAINLVVSIPIVSSGSILSRTWIQLAKVVRALNTTQSIGSVPDGTTFGTSTGSAIQIFGNHKETLPYGFVNHGQGTVPLLGATYFLGFPNQPLMMADTIAMNLLPAPENIVDGMPYGARVTAQLLSSPPYLAGALVTFLVAVIADRTQQRGLMTICLATVGIIGFLMCMLSENIYVKYAGTIVINMGLIPITPILSTWLTVNIGGYAKRAISVSMFLLSSSVAGIIGSQLYHIRDAPHFVFGHAFNISCLVITMILTFVLRWLLKRENNRRDYSVSFGVNPLKLLSKSELRDLNDKHPAFRYGL